tara:strand:+ start:930 stop:1427 length:498 start_codon:yes stop_codon:yes gene_type:complete
MTNNTMNPSNIMEFEKEYPFEIDHGKCLLCQGRICGDNWETDTSRGLTSKNADGTLKHNHICDTCQWHAFSELIEVRRNNAIRDKLTKFVDVINDWNSWKDTLYADEETSESFLKILKMIMDARPYEITFEDRERELQGMIDYVDRVIRYYGYRNECRYLEGCKI